MGLPEKINGLLVWLLQKMNLQQEVYYVGSSESLPMPLSVEEEQTLLQHLEDESEHVRQKLIEHNLRLVVYIARKFENTGIPVEDLISIGTIGLIKAVNTFDNSKKIKLATYGLLSTIEGI